MDNIVFVSLFSGIALVIGAILVGVLVGVLCRLGAKGPSNIGLGVVAAMLTITLICLGRVVWNVPSVGSAQEVVEISDDAMILSLAGSIALQSKMEGIEIAWPEGVTWESASRKEDYPPQIWQMATQQWNCHTPQQKESVLQRARDVKIAAQIPSSTSPGILGRIGIWGGCWSILGGILAFVIGGRFIE